MLTLRHRVQWRDVDFAQVVYFLRYPEWVADGFHRYLFERGFALRELVTAGYGLPYLEAECRYRRALTLEDEAEIQVRVTDLTNKGFTLRYGIYETGHPELVAEGAMVRRCVSLQPRRSQPMPENLLRILQEMAEPASGETREGCAPPLR